MESYTESLALMKQWIAYKSSRVITPIGYEEPSTAVVTMKIPVLWIGTKSDSSNRAVPSADLVASAASSLPIKWVEVSARSGSNIELMQEWLFEVWDALKSREHSIHVHCLAQLSNILSTKHCKGGTLLINLDTLGRCLRHGTLLKITKRGFRQEVTAFLFEKALLFCKPPNKGVYSVKKAVFLNLAVLTDSARGAGDYAFELHSFSKAMAPSKSSYLGSGSNKDSSKDDNTAANSWQLLALGQADKDAWMDALTFAINHFARDLDRAKYYSSIKALTLSSRPIQRHSRRQIGLAWSLLANNASSGIPIVVDSLTNYLNNPTHDAWGAFLLPGSTSEHKILNERANRLDIRGTITTFGQVHGGPSSTGSISSNRDTISGPLSGGYGSGNSSSPQSGSGASIPPPPASAGASMMTSGTNIGGGGDRTIDLNGISPTTAAEFLLGFLHASPTFIPVGFFTFLLQNCNDINLDSSTGTQQLKIAFSTLPSHVFKSVARLMFCIQQSVLNAADDSVILKIARYLQPILVKDSVEFESLNNVKLLTTIQSLIREAGEIFSMPTEAIQSPSAAAISKHHYQGSSSSSGSPSVTHRTATGNTSMASTPGGGGSSYGSGRSAFTTSAPIPLPGGPNSGATHSPRADTYSTSPFNIMSFGTPPIPGTNGNGGVTTIETDFFVANGSGNNANATNAAAGTQAANTSASSLAGLTENPRSDSQSSISDLLRGINDDPSASGTNTRGTSAVSAANAKRMGNFSALTRNLTLAPLEGMGPRNSDQVMSRVARARAIIAELLESLKSVEAIVTAPEIEAVLQSLVITCNNLSRYNWHKYLEVIETDMLEEMCYVLDAFDRGAKSKPIEKTLKSKQLRAQLATLATEMSHLMTQFTSYIITLQGHDQAAPPGDKPKPRRAGALGGATNLNASSGNVTAGGPSASNASNGAFGSGFGGASYGGTYGNGLGGAASLSNDSPLGGGGWFGGRDTVMDADGSYNVGGANSGFPGGAQGEFGADELGDLNLVSAKDWWNHVFGQHSLRVPVDKFLAELLAVSRSQIPATSISDSASSPSNNTAGSAPSSAPGSGTVHNTMSSAFSAALLSDSDMSESQPESPRVIANSATNNTSQNSLNIASNNPSQTAASRNALPLLEISQKEHNALAEFFDHQQSGFVNLLRFSQFLKSFGSIPTCVEPLLHLLRLPYYYGFLSTLEAIRLLETEDAGTYLLCFEGNDPSNWQVHLMAEAHTHKCFAIEASPNEYIIKPTRTLAVSGVLLDAATQRAPPKSPRASVSVPPHLADQYSSSSSNSSLSATGGIVPPSPCPSPTPPAALNHSSELSPRGSTLSSETSSTCVTNTPASSAPASEKFAVATPGSPNPASGTQATSSATTSPAPRIEVTANDSSNAANLNAASTYSSLAAAIEAYPNTLKYPLRSNLYNLPFFYGDISESEGMRALKNQPPGTFLIIFSASRPLQLDCLYVSAVEDRVMTITFERQRSDGHGSRIITHSSSSGTQSSKAGSSSTVSESSTGNANSSARSDSKGKIGATIATNFFSTTPNAGATCPMQALDDSSGAEINENFFTLVKEKDRVSVRVESGEVFENLSDAIRFYEAELKIPFTQKKSSGHVAMGSVHEGSLEKLVAYLYDDVVDLAYITAFLLTYRSFTQPPTLLEELITQYRHLESVPNGKPYQMRLVNFFKIWLSDFSWDLVSAQDTLSNIKDFVNSDISALFPSIAKQLQNYICKIPTEKPADPSHLKDLPTSPPVTPLSYDEPSKVMDFSAHILAQQLFAFEFELFSKIQPFELMGNGWMKADKNVRAPNIIRMIAKSNLIGSWIVAEILKEGNLKKRAALIEHFIDVVYESHKLNNFHSVMVVMSVLRDSSVARLKLTWEKVSKKSKELLEFMETKMDDEDNFAAYRTAYAQAPPPKLPYMGLVFRDLIHIEEGSPKHLPNGSINFHRCELIAEKLHLVKLSQQDRIMWPKNEDLWQYILAVPKHPDQQSQYARSLELEPRAGTPSNVGLGSSSSSVGGAERSVSSPRGSDARNTERPTTITVTSASINAAANDESLNKDKKGSRISIFTPASPSGTLNNSSTDSSANATNNANGSNSQGLAPSQQVPRSVSPKPFKEDAPSTSVQATSSPNTSPSTSSRETNPDSGKWASSKKTKQSSPLANVMGFMRKK